MKIYNWNVNGIRSIIKKESLQSFIKKYNPDILCLTETRIDYNTLNHNNFFKQYFENYYGYWNIALNKKGYSGTTILTKIKPIEYAFNDEEARITTLEFEKFLILNVYVPNVGNKLKRLEYRLNEWSHLFNKIVRNYVNSNKLMIICGDFNVCHTELDTFKMRDNMPGMTIEERTNFSDLLSKYDLCDCFRMKYPNSVM